MTQLIRKKTAVAAMVGLASGVIVNIASMGSARAATASEVISTKHVSYVDEKGTVLGSGTLTVTKQRTDKSIETYYTLDKTIPAGYALQDKSDLQHNPDKIVLVKGTTTEATSAQDMTAVDVPVAPKNTDGNSSTTDNTASTNSTTRSKTVLYVDEQGTVVGSGKITETSKSDGSGGTIFTYAVDKTIPAGYSLKSTSDLTGYPDKLTVIKSKTTANTSASEETAMASAPTTPQPTTKTVTTPNSNTINSTSTATNGQNSGTSTNTSAVTNSASATTGSEATATSTTNTNANGINSKTVTFVDEQGNAIGTGTISKTPSKEGKTIYSVDKSIPVGYALKNSTDLESYPDKLTLVKDDTSKDTSSASILDGKSIDDKDANTDSEKEKAEEKAKIEGTSSDPEEVDATGGDEDGDGGPKKSKKGSSAKSQTSSTTTTSANPTPTTDSGTSSSSELPSTGNEKDSAVLAAGTFATGASLLATVLKRRLSGEDK